jgi:hypothetical protein
MALMAAGLGVLGSVAADGLSHALFHSQGGLVKDDGLHMLHKGEIIIPAAHAKKMMSALKKAKGMSEADIKKLKLRHAKPHKKPRPK